MFGHCSGRCSVYDHKHAGPRDHFTAARGHSLRHEESARPSVLMSSGLSSVSFVAGSSHSLACLSTFTKSFVFGVFISQFTAELRDRSTAHDHFVGGDLLTSLKGVVDKDHYPLPHSATASPGLQILARSPPTPMRVHYRDETRRNFNENKVTPCNKCTCNNLLHVLACNFKVLALLIEGLQLLKTPL